MGKLPMFEIADLPIFCVTDLEKVDTAKFRRYIVVAADGLFEVVHTGFGSLSRKITKILTENADEEMGEMFVPLFPKIPMATFKRVIAFFQAVYKKHYSEAAVLLYLNEAENEWILYCPTQEVATASVDYSIEAELDDDEELKELYRSPDITKVGTIHSHASMGAGHSTVDDKDEVEEDGLHITIGSFKSTGYDSLTFSFSFVWRGSRFQLKPIDIIEGWDDPFGAFPKTWLDKVSKETKTNNYTGGGSGHHQVTKSEDEEEKKKDNGTGNKFVRTCIYRHKSFKCKLPPDKMNRCRFHDLLGYQQKVLEQAKSVTLVECSCGCVYFKEVGTSCYGNEHRTLCEKSFSVELFRLLAEAELVPGSLLSWGKELAVNILNGLEQIALKRTKSSKKILAANYLLRKTLDEIRLALSRSV